jgi:hypothetical protein
MRLPRAKSFTRSVTPGLLLAGASLLALTSACAEAKDPAPGPQAGRAAGGTANAGAAGGGAAGTGGATAGTSGAFAGGAPPAAGAGGGAGGGAAGAAGNAGGAAGAAPGASGAGASASGASGASGSGGGAGIGSGTLTLSEFEVEPNPNMTISCFVSWTTAEPASSEVQFGEEGYEFRIRDEELVTNHRVLVIGMHAQKTYRIRAVSANRTGTGSADGTFMTGMLPSGITTPELTVDDFANAYPGWTLTNIQSVSSTTAKIVIYDQNGLPVWYFVHGTASDARGDVSTELLSDGVLVGPTSGVPARLVDLSGEVSWEGPPNSTQQLMSHFVYRTAGGNYVLNRELDKSVMNGSTRIDDQRLEEITPEREVVWSWNLFDHVEPSGSKEELCHGNNLTFDDAAGFLYYNCRWVGLFKIHRMSGDIEWRMGGTYDETSLGPGDFTFSPPDSQFSDAHEPDWSDDGTLLLLYDNGGYAGLGGGGGSQNFHSRIVEYRIDQTALTATRTFEFPGDFTVDAWYQDDWYTPFWGDADRLPNGNILVTAGVRSQSAASRIFEITREGKVVWELTFPTGGGGSYKAQRLVPPPLVEPMP